MHRAEATKEIMFLIVSTAPLCYQPLIQTYFPIHHSSICSLTQFEQVLRLGYAVKMIRSIIEPWTSPDPNISLDYEHTDPETQTVTLKTSQLPPDNSLQV